MGLGLLAALFPPRKTPLDVEEEPSTEAVNEVEYRALSRKAGFDGAEIALERQCRDQQRAADIRALRRFLAENGIAVYSESRVIRYMESITPSGHRWYWYRVGQEHHGIGLYKKPIPAPVLMTMAKIREAFPEVRFEVTDIEELPKGDPFLRAGQHGTWFIIERWDEPGFRM